MEQGVLEFPCYHTFKVFGHSSDLFSAQVRGLIAARTGAIPLDSTRVRRSERGRYLCVSVIAELHSREQLEQIYSDLHAHCEVLLCL